MKRLQEAAVVLSLMDALKERESWCGETHLQKAVYFLKEMTGVPIDCEFILYKHGSFSFDLRDELTAMRADGLVELQIQPQPYGPSLRSTEVGRLLEEDYPKTIGRYAGAINFIADQLGDKGVAELERLATALFVTKARPEASVEERTKRIHELKPHVSIEEALRAVRAVDQMQAQAQRMQQ